jgi:hypothetical protein
MAGNIQVPRDLTKVVEVKDTSDPLRRFLTDLLNRITILEAQALDYEARIAELEP